MIFNSHRLILYLLCLCTFAQSQTWTQLADFPGLQRDDGVAAIVNNKAYVGTGSNGFALENNFYCFDLANNTWTVIASMPAGTERQYASAFTYSNYIFVTGGLDAGSMPLSDSYRYNISTNTWSLMAQKPGSALWGSMSFTLGSRAYVVGGKDASSASSQDVWEYDILNNTWTQKNNLFGPRWRGFAAVLNNIPYLLFGVDNSGTGAFRKEIYKYNQSSDSWTKVGDFPLSGRIYSAMQAANNKLVMFGGLDSLNNFYNDCWLFDEINGFVQTASLPSSARKGGMSFSNGNKFYYTCGVNSASARLKETWILDVYVGVKENWPNEIFSVGPNPFHDALHIASSTENTTEVEVYDLMGSLVLCTRQSLINTSMLQNGIYLLKMKSDEIISWKKLVKE